MPTPLQLAAVTAAALALTTALGGPLIGLLRRAGAGQRVRNDGPQRHLGKEGTPTMGGVLILGAALLAAAGGEWWAGGSISPAMLALLAATAAFGCIGAADDWMKIRRGRSLGLRARYKLALQFVVAAGVVYAAAGHRAMYLAGSGDLWSFHPLWAAFWLLATVGASNAVNLADGLDGLAAGLCTVSAIGFAILALTSGQREVAFFGLALAGACAGFLVFNVHPARMFMGDVGALGLGAAMAAMAALLDQPLALAGLLLVPWAEELSVIAQVISFKSTGRRVFKMSPLHHHFELSGWPERRVVLTFWMVGAAAAALVVAISVMS